MTRVLLVHAGARPSSFIAQDRDLLARHFDVTTLAWTRAADALAMARALRRHDVVFSWFLGHHAAAAALTARVLRKRSIAVLGGIEPAAPDVAGAAPSRRDRAAILAAYNLSDLVLAVSHFTLDEGLLLRRGEPRSEVRLLHNGVDTERFRPQGAKEPVVLTVAVLEEGSVRRKRVATFVRAAALAPEARWVVVGPRHDASADRLGALAGPNVHLAGHVSDDELLAWYRRAAVYVQASLHESFGMANAEAMACAAVPVVARAGALPEVVGEAGLYLDEPVTPESLAAKAREALRSGLGPAARARVVERFDARRREAGLVAAVEDAARGRLVPGVRLPSAPAEGSFGHRGP